MSGEQLIAIWFEQRNAVERAALAFENRIFSKMQRNLSRDESAGLSPAQPQAEVAPNAFRPRERKLSLSRRVYEFHNGHPVGTSELQAAFPDERSQLLNQTRANLASRGLLERVNYGVYQRRVIADSPVQNSHLTD